MQPEGDLIIGWGHCPWKHLLVSSFEKSLFNVALHESTGCHEIGREQFDGGDSGGYLDRRVEAVPHMRQWIERVGKEAGCCLSLAEGFNARCSCLGPVLREKNLPCPLFHRGSAARWRMCRCTYE